MFPLLALLSLLVTINAEGHLKGRPSGYTPVVHQAAIKGAALDQITLRDIPIGQVAYGSKSGSSYSPISQLSVTDRVLHQTQQRPQGENPSHIYFNLGDSGGLSGSQKTRDVGNSYRIGQSQVPYGVSGLDYSSFPAQQYENGQAVISGSGVGGKGYTGGAKSVLGHSQKGISGIGSGSPVYGKRNPSYHIGQSNIPYGASGLDFYSYPEQRPHYESIPYSSRTKTSPSGGAKGGYPSIVVSSSGIGKGGISNAGKSSKGSFTSPAGRIQQGISPVVSKTSPAHPSVTGIGQAKLHFNIGDSQTPYQIGQSQIPYGVTGQDFYSYPTQRINPSVKTSYGGVKGVRPDSSIFTKGGSRGGDVTQRPIGEIKGIGGLGGSGLFDAQKGIKTSPGATKGAKGNVQINLGDILTSYQIGQSQIPYGATGYDYSSYPQHEIRQSYYSTGVKSGVSKGGISSLGTSSKGGIAGVSSSSKGGIGGLGSSNKGGIGGIGSSNKGGIGGIGSSSKGGIGDARASSKGGIHDPVSQTSLLRAGQVKGGPGHVQFTLGDSQTSYHIGQSQIPYGASGVDYFSYPSGRYSQSQSKTSVSGKTSGSTLGGGSAKSSGKGSLAGTKGQIQQNIHTYPLGSDSAQHRLTGITGALTARPITTSRKTYAQKRDTSIASQLAQLHLLDTDNGKESIPFSIDDSQKVSLGSGQSAHLSAYGGGLSQQSRSGELSDKAVILGDSSRAPTARTSSASLYEKHGSGTSGLGDLKFTSTGSRRSQSFSERTEHSENPAKIQFSLGSGEGFSTFGSQGASHVSGSSSAGERHVGIRHEGAQITGAISGGSAVSSRSGSLHSASRLGSGDVSHGAAAVTTSHDSSALSRDTAIGRLGADYRSGGVGGGAGARFYTTGSEYKRTTTLGGVLDAGSQAYHRGGEYRQRTSRVRGSSVTGAHTGVSTGSGVQSYGIDSGYGQRASAVGIGGSSGTHSAGVRSDLGIQSYSTGGGYRQRVTGLGGSFGAGSFSTGERTNLRQSYGRQSLGGQSAAPGENPAKIQFSIGDGQGFSTYGTERYSQTSGSASGIVGAGLGRTRTEKASVQTYRQDVSVLSGGSGTSARLGSPRTSTGVGSQSAGYGSRIQSYTSGGQQYASSGESGGKAGVQPVSFRGDDKVAVFSGDIGHEIAAKVQSGGVSGSLGASDQSRSHRAGGGVRSGIVGYGAGTQSHITGSEQSKYTSELRGRGSAELLSGSIDDGAIRAEQLRTIESGTGSKAKSSSIGSRAQSYTSSSGYRQHSTNLGGGGSVGFSSAGSRSGVSQSSRAQTLTGSAGAVENPAKIQFSLGGDQGFSTFGSQLVSHGADSSSLGSGGIDIRGASIQKHDHKIAGVGGGSEFSTQSGSFRSGAAVGSRSSAAGVGVRSGDAAISVGGTGAEYKLGGAIGRQAARSHTAAGGYRRTTLGGGYDAGSQAYHSGGEYKKRTSTVRSSSVTGAHTGTGVSTGSGVQSYGIDSGYGQRASAVGIGGSSGTHSAGVGSDLGIQSYSTGGRYRQRVTGLGGGLGAGAVSTGARSSLAQSYGRQSLREASVPSENPAKIQFSFGDGQGFSTYGTQKFSQASGLGSGIAGVGPGRSIERAGVETHGAVSGVSRGTARISSSRSVVEEKSGGVGAIETGSFSSSVGERTSAHSGSVGGHSTGARVATISGERAVGVGYAGAGQRSRGASVGTGIQSYDIGRGNVGRVPSLGGSLGGGIRSHATGGKRFQSVRSSDAAYVDQSLSEKGEQGQTGGFSVSSARGDNLQTRNLAKEKSRTESALSRTGHGTGVTHSLDNPAKITFTLGGEKIIDYSLPSSAGGSQFHSQSHSTSFRSRAQGSTSSRSSSVGSRAGGEHSGASVGGTQDSTGSADIHFTLGDENIVDTSSHGGLGAEHHRTASYRSQSRVGSLSGSGISGGELRLENQGARGTGAVRSEAYEGAYHRTGSLETGRRSVASRAGARSSGQEISTYQGSSGPAQIYFSLGDSKLIDTSAQGGSLAAGRSSFTESSRGSGTRSSGSPTSGISGEGIYLTEEDLTSGKVISLDSEGRLHAGSIAGSTGQLTSRTTPITRSSVSYHERIEHESNISHEPLDASIDLDSVGIIDADAGGRSQGASLYKQTQGAIQGVSGGAQLGEKLKFHLSDIGSLAEGTAQAVQKKLEQIVV